MPLRIAKNKFMKIITIITSYSRCKIKHFPPNTLFRMFLMLSFSYIIAKIIVLAVKYTSYFYREAGHRASGSHFHYDEQRHSPES